jgi:hypothetical protein
LGERSQTRRGGLALALEHLAQLLADDHVIVDFLGGWSPMPADPFHPDRLDGEARFRADLVAYLGSPPLGELAELLGKLPRSRQQPLGLGVLMIALNERLPDGYKLLPPAGHPGPGEGADARCARWSPTAAPPAPAGTLMGRHQGWLSRWLTANIRPTCTLTVPRRARWASGGWPRRCARAAEPDPAAGRQARDPLAERERPARPGA